MQNDRFILLSSLVLGFFLLTGNVAYGGVAVVGPHAVADNGYGMSFDDSYRNGANFKTFSEPESDGFASNSIASGEQKEGMLSAKVKQELKSNENLKDADVEVTEEGDGTIALEGTVKSEEQKEAAKQIASKIEGVHAVRDKLIVQN